MLNRLLEFNLKHKYSCFSLCLLLSLGGFWLGRDLPLRLSLADLLPEQRESVVDMRAVEKEVGGAGYLIILIGPITSPERFLSSAENALKSLPEVKYVFSERETYTLRDHTLQLLPRSDLKKLVESAQTVFGDGQTRGIDLGLSDAEDLDESREEARAHLKKLSQQGSDKETRFFLSKDQLYAMLLAKPVFDSEDLARSAKLVDDADAVLKKSLGEKFPVKLLGRYVEKVIDTRQINSDISFTGLISLIGIALALIFGLGAFRGTVVTIAGVFLSMGWTLGIAKISVGQINILTGFLLAILSGLGVEYGIHLIRRYYQERAMGHAHEIAIRIAYIHLGRALFSAAVTSASAFLILSISDFRGFSELGKIAGGGVISIYLVYMLSFPLAGEFLREKPRFARAIEAFGFYPVTLNWRWSVFGLLAIVSFGVFRAEFEYDFERMHDLSAEVQSYNKLTDQLFGKSMSPAALLAKDRAQALEVEEWLKEPERANIVKNAISLGSLIPANPEWRVRQIDRLRDQFNQISPQTFLKETGIAPKTARKWLDSPWLKEKELPQHVLENFGSSGNIVLAYPMSRLDHAEALRPFTKMMIEAKSIFAGLKIGSEARVFAEILDHIEIDGKLVLILFLIGAFFVFWLDFRSLKDALALEVQLASGIFLLVALMGAFDVRFSILNVAMIPAVLAAGIDMGVHVRHREKEGFGPLESARFVAQAVQLSLVTTIMGFGALFFAEAGMLKGIAWISVLGQLSMYFICMIAFPLGKEWWRTRSDRKSLEKKLAFETSLRD